MKALPTIASNRGRLNTAGDLIGRLRLSYEDFMFLAILSDACAIVLASIAAGIAKRDRGVGRVCGSWSTGFDAAGSLRAARR